jgi:hypothetical protein
MALAYVQNVNHETTHLFHRTSGKLDPDKTQSEMEAQRLLDTDDIED